MINSRTEIHDPKAATVGPSRRTKILLLALATLLVCVTMGRVVFNDMIWDDPFLISGFDGSLSPRGLWQTITTPFWDNSSYYASQLTDFWRPLTLVLLWTGGKVFGGWTPGYHLLSLLASLGAVLAFFFLLRKLVPKDGSREIAPWLALVFAAHPLNAEVLGMVANLSDHLALLFLLIQVGLLMDVGRGYHSRIHPPAIALCSLLACASKELGILAALGPMAAWLLMRGIQGEDRGLLRKASTWIASVLPVVLYLVVRASVIAATGREQSLLGDSAFSLEVVLLGWGLAVKGAVVPIPNGAHSFVASGDMTPWLVAGLAWAGLLFMVVRSAIKNRLSSLTPMGLLFALALLIPSLLAVQISEDALRFPTRYFHLPLAGLLVATLPLVVRSWSRGARIVLPAVVVLLTLLSWVRIAEWRSNVEFFAAESGYHPRSVGDRLNLAQAQCKVGAFGDAEATLDNLKTLPRADDPTSISLAQNARAKIALLRDGDIEKASKHMRLALIARPMNLDNVLALAELRSRAHRPDQAIVVLKKALAAKWFDERGRQRIEQEIRIYQRTINSSVKKKDR